LVAVTTTDKLKQKRKEREEKKTEKNNIRKMIGAFISHGDFFS
jgi:hypothetical protein